MLNIKQLPRWFDRYLGSNCSYQSKRSVLPWRWRAVAVFFTSLFVMLSVRLFDVQMVRGETFWRLAEDNRFFSQRMQAERGVILDRYGLPLTWNEKSYYLLNPELPTSNKRVPLTREQALPLLASDSSKINTSLYRQYRFPDSLALVLGYTGLVTAEELEKDNTLHLQSWVGKTGLEKRFDSWLRGQDGEAVYEVNAHGERQRLVRQHLPQPGKLLHTTLDPMLQELAYQSLGDAKGSVVITDATSGAVLALVSKPSFSLRLFQPFSATASDSAEQSEVLIQRQNEELKQAFNDPRQLFFNRAISGAYPPGSIFKVITMLAGLDSGAFDLQTSVVDEGVLRVGEYEYRNWYFTQYGRTEGALSVVRALARSNDIFFYKAAEWIGPTKLAEEARKFGLGSAPPIEIGGAVAGLVPDPSWKVATLGEPWYLGNTYHFGIGQGDLLVTPLQMAKVVQTVSQMGSSCQLHLQTDFPTECTPLGLDTVHFQSTLEGMIAACSPGGTGYPFFPRNTEKTDLSQGAVACKTGTAEFGGRDEQGYRSTHGWFVAAVSPQLQLPQPELTQTAASNEVSSQEILSRWQTKELDRDEWLKLVSKTGFPKTITITVLVESDDTVKFREGSRDAAPVAKAILDWIEGATTNTNANATVPVTSTAVDSPDGE